MLLSKNQTEMFQQNLTTTIETIIKIDYNDTTLIIEEDQKLNAQSYTFSIFIFICFLLVLFMVLFIHNFCVLIFKSFNCFENDSFCYLGDYSSSDNKKKSLTNLNMDTISTNEPLVQDLFYKNDVNFYGILTNYTNNNKAILFPNTQTESTDFNYSTNTFKSFKTLDNTQKKKTSIDNDYLDIYNTFGNVAESINEMLTKNELDKIESDLTKSITEIQKIQLEMCSIQDEKLDTDSIKSSEQIISLLPMPDLDSLTDLECDYRNDDTLSLTNNDSKQETA